MSIIETFCLILRDLLLLFLGLQLYHFLNSNKLHTYLRWIGILQWPFLIKFTFKCQLESLRKYIFRIKTKVIHQVHSNVW